MTDPDDERVTFLMQKWKIPRVEAKRLMANENA